MNSLTLGYSPCPNDTFIFYALVHGRVDTGNYSFKEILLDVETLNQKASFSELDFTKVSYHAFGHFRENYCLLRSGGALGRGCGPLIVSKKDYTMQELLNKKIAIPGELTTAYLLLQLYDPLFKMSSMTGKISVMPFNNIMTSVASGEADAGLIIHESRFTYPSYGLKEILDLGSWWEKETALPIPLGCILGKRSLGKSAMDSVNSIIKKSIEYAFQNPAEAFSYIKQHSQELSEDVINQHIRLYVNNFSLDLGTEGEKAVSELFQRAEEAGIIPKSKAPLFID